MFKANKSVRALGLVAPMALTIALAAPAANAEMMEQFWSTADETGWVTGYGECWQSDGGPTDVPPCAKEIIESYTIDLDNDEFDFDKAALKPEMEVALDDLARRVKESKGEEQLTIVGHTDGVGSQDYNLGLGQRRADSTMDYLVTAGGLNPARIGTESRGKHDPVATNETDEGRAKNRRVEVRAEVYTGEG
ncbi:MAG: OmpA family protein [Pseudomonadota bacterium]|nr:OmpA family protein [Pseudomonadota bacterium]